jgi:hypothetical protein
MFILSNKCTVLYKELLLGLRQSRRPPGEDRDYELGFGGLLLPVLHFLESSGGANKALQDAPPLQAVLCMHVTSTCIYINTSSFQGNMS